MYLMTVNCRELSQTVTDCRKVIDFRIPPQTTRQTAAHHRIPPQTIIENVILLQTAMAAPQTKLWLPQTTFSMHVGNIAKNINVEWPSWLLTHIHIHYTHVCTHALHAYELAHMHASSHASMHAMHTCMHTSAHIQIHIHAHTAGEWTHTRTQARTHMHTHITHTHKHTYTHTHTHTHVCAHALTHAMGVSVFMTRRPTHLEFLH